MCLCAAITPEWLPYTDNLTVMKSKLKIATYDCQGMKSSESYIMDQLRQVNILVLQET